MLLTSGQMSSGQTSSGQMFGPPSAQPLPARRTVAATAGRPRSSPPAFPFSARLGVAACPHAAGRAAAPAPSRTPRARASRPHASPAPAGRLIPMEIAAAAAAAAAAVPPHRMPARATPPAPRVRSPPPFQPALPAVRVRLALDEV